MEQQHLEICEELHVALDAQASREKVQKLERKEAKLRHDITLSKEEHAKERAFQQRELDNMEFAHDAVCSRLGHLDGRHGWHEASGASNYDSRLAFQTIEGSWPMQAVDGSMSVMQECVASPVVEQVKAEQLKSDVGEV